MGSSPIIRCIYGGCGGIGRHTGLWFRRRGIASSSLVTYPKTYILFIQNLLNQVRFSQIGIRSVNEMMKKIWNYMLQAMVMYGEFLNRMNGRIM